MNSITKIFPISYDLLCMYHITKHARDIISIALETKQVNGEDEKIVKLGQILESIIDDWVL